MQHPLNNEQLLALLKSSPIMDEVAMALPQAQQAKLLDLQQRAGNAYASVAQAQSPTIDDAQQVLGEAYLTLENQKSKLKDVMDAMQLTPSSKRGNWLTRAVDSIVGIWR